ncbi:Retrovirus-related Pol polyprotein from transposon TNT 1-94 [Salvia divinorum]|uniref:Retrovirus-related Pol polyprotein from transposon TNT 1-94 n=1 Tax=Salvia divinorum TaxID=28513 RepID=A0ABD1FXE2_SALDI
MASRFEAERFNGKNDYGLWKMKMKMRALLIQQGLVGALKPADPKEKGGEPLDEKAQQQQEEMLLKAHSAVILCLGDKVLREVQDQTTAAGILTKLDELYLGNSLANRLYLKRRLYSYCFVEERSIMEQYDDFLKSVDDLEVVDGKMKDEDKAILVLNALPKSYDQLRDAILYGRDKPITLAEVHSALMAKELQKVGRNQDSQVQESLNIKKFKNKKGGKKDAPKQNSKDGNESRSCHWCKKPGHLKRDCFAWKKKQAEEAAGNKQTTDCVQEVENAHALNIMEEVEESSWILDSGCSFHICSKINWFDSISEATGSVVLGNNQVCKIEGIGSIRLRLADKSTKILTEVRYIPEVKRNLISLGTLERKGYAFHSSGGVMMVGMGGERILQAKRKGSLYYLNAAVVKNGELNSVKAESVKLWHQRLGHPAFESIDQLIKRNVITSDGEKNDQSCEECILAKSKKLSYPKGKHTSSAPLDYAHSDLWGPAPVNSVGGGRYYMSIIDDYSRKIWLYILKEKSEAFGKFREWCKLMETKKRGCLKCLRTDNGLEFLSKEFESFCQEKGIERHRTVPLNPQQNGVAERANRTILERVRSMLLASGMEKRFWAEAS